jgi:hypothetical protein
MSDFWPPCPASIMTQLWGGISDYWLFFKILRSFSIPRETRCRAVFNPCLSCRLLNFESIWPIRDLLLTKIGRSMAVCKDN